MNPSSWIDKVDTVIIELHERVKSGCNRSFYKGTTGFDDEWMQGENVYLTRHRGGVSRSPRKASDPLALDGKKHRRAEASLTRRRETV